MWIKNTNGNFIVDLKKSHYVHIMKSNYTKEFCVQAQFLCFSNCFESDGDQERIVIKSFDTREEAEDYLDYLLKELQK